MPCIIDSINAKRFSVIFNLKKYVFSHFTLIMSSVIVPVQNEKTYAGACKDRCEKSRGGGPHAFQLKCKSAYYSQEEMNDCIQDCSTACPEKYCPSGETILCEEDGQGVDQGEIDLDEYKTKLLQEHEDDLESRKSKVEADVISMAVAFALVVILAIALSVWAYRKKKALAALELQRQQAELLESINPNISTATVQPYPPPAIRRQSLNVDGRVDSDGRVFIDGRANNNLKS